MATTALSRNWRQLQKTLEKASSTTSTNSLKRKSPSVESPTTSSSSTTTSAKRTKRVRTLRSTAATTTITSPANLTSIPQTPKPAPILKVPEMSVTTAKPSAALALWAEDNDISLADLRKAYDLLPTSTTLPPPPAGSAVGPEASGTSSATETGKYISLDCEMVGVGGPTNERSALARVSIVNYHGHVILDTFVRPKEKVTDWRTWVSGVTPVHMTHAREFEDVQKEVSAILMDRVLVGHAVKNDLEALLLSHPRRDVRDTSRHPEFRKFSAGRTPALKKLAHEVLGIEIQGGEHSSIEDARACMLLYRKFRDEIEKLHKPKLPQPKGASAGSGRKNRKKKKRKEA